MVVVLRNRRSKNVAGSYDPESTVRVCGNGPGSAFNRYRRRSSESNDRKRFDAHCLRTISRKISSIHSRTHRF
uniref:Uncharacterized protein n=1 Tax=Romanomermis culicivorax TaxID=13658 RepID=A0A915JR51_ROMCU